MRRWHKLKANKMIETAHNLVFFDTETHQERLSSNAVRHVLDFGWLCARRRVRGGGWGREDWARFKTVDEFWEAITTRSRKRSRTFAFCHNTNFDLPVLDVFRAHARQGWWLASAVIEGPPTIITMKRGTSTLIFLDTLNWWREPLAKLGEKVGLAKLTMPSGRASPAEWDTYCKRDVEIIMAMMLAWLAFLQQHDLGGFAPTAASQAFRSWRHRFMPDGVVVDADPAALTLARESYHGGRCECFQIGHVKGPLYELDVNSMYGSVMRGGGFPARLCGVRNGFAVERLPVLIDRYAVVARVRLVTDHPVFPVLMAGKLIFPIGRFAATLTTPELEYALCMGSVESVREVAIYTAADLFTAYVDFFYAMRRLEGGDREGVDAKMGRLMLNSLYGKFGQHGRVYVKQEYIKDLTCRTETIIDADTGKVYRLRQMAGLRQVLKDEGESRDSHPAIAAHVTAYARLTLWLLMLKAGRDNVVYCDTDSLVVTQAGFDAFDIQVGETRLGALKLQGVHPWADLRGPKDYELGSVVKIKGVRKEAVQLAPGVYQQAKWSGLKGLVRAGHVDAPTTETVTKRLRRVYDKGKVLPGGVVHPLVLDDP